MQRCDGFFGSMSAHCLWLDLLLYSQTCRLTQFTGFGLSGWGQLGGGPWMLAERVKRFTVFPEFWSRFSGFRGVNSKSHGQAFRFLLEAGNIGFVGAQETSVAEGKIFSRILAR